MVKIFNVLLRGPVLIAILCGRIWYRTSWSPKGSSCNMLIVGALIFSNWVQLTNHKWLFFSWNQSVGLQRSKACPSWKKSCEKIPLEFRYKMLIEQSLPFASTRHILPVGYICYKFCKLHSGYDHCQDFGVWCLIVGRRPISARQTNRTVTKPSSSSRLDEQQKTPDF